MKITGLKTFVANASRTNFVFVKLYTDAGIDGVGEATLEWRTKTVLAAVEELERFIVGQDPPPFSFRTATPLQPLPPGSLEADVTVDRSTDARVFDPSHLSTDGAVGSPCATRDIGIVPVVFGLGALGVVLAYGAMVRRFVVRK